MGNQRSSKRMIRRRITLWIMENDRWIVVGSQLKRTDWVFFLSILPVSRGKSHEDLQRCMSSKQRNYMWMHVAFNVLPSRLCKTHRYTYIKNWSNKFLWTLVNTYHTRLFTWCSSIYGEGRRSIRSHWLKGQVFLCLSYQGNWRASFPWPHGITVTFAGKKPQLTPRQDRGAGKIR